jgi:FtsH-binding integral membrane protein
LKIQDGLLIALTALLGIANGLLAFFKQGDLRIYFVVGAIVYFVTTWFFIALKPRLRNALTAVGIILFIGFIIIATFEIIDILRKI